METFAGGIAVLVVLLFSIAGLAKVLRPEATALSLVSVLGENRWPRSISPRWAGRLLGALEIAVAISIAFAHTRQNGLIAAAALATCFAAYTEAARRTKSACGCGGTGNDAAAVRDVVRAAFLACATVVAATLTGLSGGLPITLAATRTGGLLFIAFAFLIWWLPSGRFFGSRKLAPVAPPAPAQPQAGATVLPLVSEKRHGHDAAEVDLVRHAREYGAGWTHYFANLQTQVRDAENTVLSTAPNRLSRRRLLRGVLVVAGGSIAATAFPRNLTGEVYASEISRQFYPPRQQALVITPLLGASKTRLIDAVPYESHLDQFLNDRGQTIEWTKAEVGRAVAYFSFWSPRVPLPQYDMVVAPLTPNGFLAWSPNLLVGNGDGSYFYATDGIDELKIADGSVTVAASTCNKKPAASCVLAGAGTILGAISLIGCTTCPSPTAPLSCLSCAAGVGSVVIGGILYTEECSTCEATQLQKQTACVASNFAFGYAAPCCIARGGNCRVFECCGCSIPGEPSCRCHNGCPQSLSGHACISYFGQDGTFCGCGCCCWMGNGDGIGP